DRDHSSFIKNIVIYVSKSGQSPNGLEQHEGDVLYHFQVESTLANVAELAFFFEQAGVGLGREEMQRVFLALKQLVDSQRSSAHRATTWWLRGNSEKVKERRRRGQNRHMRMRRGRKRTRMKQMKSLLLYLQADPPPKSTYKTPPPVPKEENHSGVNKYTYFVCQEVARQTPRFITGRLDGTHVSPLGFYHYEENLNFEGIRVNESLNLWVHHIQHILTQVRYRLFPSLCCALWPGSYAYASGSLETYTIGWGIKYIGEAFFHHPKMGNPSGPEITEALDPSVKEEQALKAALEEQTKALDETEDLEDEEEED
uniref:Radial spoke head component 4A n=1 Tax=Cyprinus carpio TaxID=7962 RepID=A0A8C2E596_CYPCA